MHTISDEDLAARYPSPLIRGRRIGRLNENYISAAATDAATCRTLGEEQIGWFIGGVSTYDWMIELVRRLDTVRTGGHWVVVPATQYLAEIAAQIWNGASQLPLPNKPGSAMWHGNSVTFCVPEQLAKLQFSREVSLAGIILLDPNCIVHRGRSYGSGQHRYVHDRPQLIVDFRSKLAIGQWSPPQIIMSLRKAAAVPTAAMARVYGLEALAFIEGSSLRCGQVTQNVMVQELVESGRSSNALAS